MKISCWTLSLALAFAVVAVNNAGAESPYERDQREQLEHYQQSHPVSPQVQQAQRWEREWRQQHPNEPMPSFGVLEKMHRGETIANIHHGFEQMRQARQEELRREHQMAKEHQQRVLAAQHLTWSAQRWNQWEQQYTQEHRQQAEDYLKAVAEAGEMARLEQARDEEEKRRKAAQ